MIYSFNAYGEMIESHQEIKQISEPVVTDPVIEEKPVSIAPPQQVVAPVVEAPVIVDDGALGQSVLVVTVHVCIRVERIIL